MERNVKVKVLQNSPFLISLDPADEIDKGSFAKVVKAFNKDNLAEQLVAKIISCKDEDIASTIKSEIQILRKIPRHPNLVNCLKVQLSSENNFYLIMQYCNGGNLESFITKNKNKFTEQQIKDFLIQFCAGYKVLLDNGIIHRDIKPQNIMIHNDSYKIADFGFAKIFRPQQAKLNINLSMKGTPLYMAPELFFDKQGSSKIDMFSLGIILYRLAYDGYYPFYNPKKFYPNSTEYAKDMLNKPLVIPNNNRSKELTNLIQKMLIKNKEQRISWQELFNDPYLNAQQNNKVMDRESKLITQIDFKKKIEYARYSMIKSKQIQQFDGKMYQDQIMIQSIFTQKSDIHKKLYKAKRYYTLIQHCTRKLIKFHQNNQHPLNLRKLALKISVSGLQYSLNIIKELQETSGNWELIKNDIGKLEDIFNKDRQILLEFLKTLTDKQRYLPKEYEELLYDLFIQFCSYKSSVKRQLLSTVRLLLQIYDYVNNFVNDVESEQLLEKYIHRIENKKYEQIQKQVNMELKKRGLLLS